MEFDLSLPQHSLVKKVTALQMKPKRRHFILISFEKKRFYRSRQIARATNYPTTHSSNACFGQFTSNLVRTRPGHLLLDGKEHTERRVDSWHESFPYVYLFLPLSTRDSCSEPFWLYDAQRLWTAALLSPWGSRDFQQDVPHCQWDQRDTDRGSPADSGSLTSPPVCAGDCWAGLTTMYTWKNTSLLIATGFYRNKKESVLLLKFSPKAFSSTV